MKKPLAILLILCLGSCSKTEKKVAETAVTEETVAEKTVSKQPVYLSDLVEVEGKLYEKYSDKPYTGDVSDTTGWGDNIAQGYIHLGYRTGNWVVNRYVLFPDISPPDSLVTWVSPIVAEVSYKDNKMVYQKIFHDNGELNIYTIYWDNGERKLSERFNDKGEKIREFNYDENGEFHGNVMSVSSDSTINSAWYEHGEIINSSFETKRNK